LFVGKLSDSVSRKWLLGLTCLAWSTSTFAAGQIDNYGVFSAMRLSLGFFSVAAIPPALGLIRDIFPANFQSRAVGIYLSSDPIGCALSSLTLLVIE
jgi:MFS family permease